MIEASKSVAGAITDFAQSSGDEMDMAIDGIIERLSMGGKVIAFGNGGSASDAQHICGELIGWFNDKDRPGIPAIDLVGGASTITAISNDTSYDNVFARQVETLANKDDILIGISTSGNSINVVNALKSGKKLGCFNVGLSSGEGGNMKAFCSVMLNADSKETPIIQQVHEFAYHYLCGEIERLSNEQC